ncbi:helix-turn-helix domain-containing protein [Acetivibrio clariflavus]|uniref:winged helix-turn-helix domain-containing protein n=1 Tax=Acetivibrio clariflavus TaxID=288965 RepID=UPI0031F53681
MLAKNKGIVSSRDKLLDLVWGYDYAIDSRSVDIHILRLRKKLGDCNGMLIKTVFGVGYKLDN